MVFFNELVYTWMCTEWNMGIFAVKRSNTDLQELKSEEPKIRSGYKFYFDLPRKVVEQGSQHTEKERKQTIKNSTNEM